MAGSRARFPVGRVFCIGRNYRWSAEEPAPQEMPAWFMKPATAVVEAEGVIPYPPGTHDFCHEIELVVAIGLGGQDIVPAAVEQDHIWGYAAGLDLSRRDLRLLRNTVYARRGRQFRSALLQNYFEQAAWYSSDPAYSDGKLSALDQRNIKLIRSVEDSLGGPLSDKDHKEEDGWLSGA